jgi:hypothetical protein
MKPAKGGAADPKPANDNRSSRRKALVHEPPFIIGIDAEWVKETAERNRILSYQYACIVGDARWSGIIYPRKPGDRLLFGQLLGRAISDGIEAGHITRWPDQVTVTAHWTRADLSAFKDFRALKRGFDGVRKTYVTTGRPLKITPRSTSASSPSG